jgi:hypothetical protein
MAAKNNCIKRDVCIFAKESFCKSNSECGHYIMEKGFTSTNKQSTPLKCDSCGKDVEQLYCNSCLTDIISKGN